jgi:hypothetical protein
MQAITTTYHGPTNTRGSRITAKADAGRITVSWNHALDAEANHVAAAAALQEKLGWGEEYGRMVQGWLPGNSGPAYAFVFVGR